MRHRGFRLLAAILLACLWTPAMAQSGGLRVRVVDPAGDPLPGAIVTLRNAAQLVAETSAQTDARGRVEFPILRPGAGYSVAVSFPGYVAQTRSGERVRLEETRELTITMSTSVEERIEVRASRQMVDLEETKHSTRFGDEFLADLPVEGRQYQNALRLAPGVLDSDEDGNPNVHGSRSRDFKTLVNGVSNVDPLTGNWLSSVNPDSIEELEVIPAGAGVEFGRAQGGFARVLQKQGSNELGGVFNMIYASSRFDATPDSGAPPDYSTSQPAIQVSGPILRDRLWFRAAYEAIRREDPVDFVQSVALATQRQTVEAYQVTWQASPRNKLAVQFQRDPKTLTNVNVSSRVPPEASQRQELGGSTWSLTWTGAQSPRVLIDSNIAWQEGRSNVLPSEAGVINSCVKNERYPVLDLAQCFLTNRNSLSGSYYIASQDRRQRLTVGSHADIFAGRFWGGSHRLKVGFAIENERYYRDLEQHPDLDFSIVQRGFSFIGEASYRLPFPTTTSSRVTGVNWGMYLEDQYRPSAGLTLTLGLRADREQLDSVGWSPFDPAAEARRFREGQAAGGSVTTLFSQIFTAYQDPVGFQQYIADVVGVDVSRSPVGGVTAQSATWLHRRQPSDVRLRNANLAPRFAAAWDPAGDGKTKLSLSVGRYYDKIFLGVPLIEVEPVTSVLNFEASRDAEQNFRVDAQIGNASQITTRVVDRGLRTPFQDEIAAGFEREIAAETALRLTYIHRHFQDQLQDFDVNHAPYDFGRCIARYPWVSALEGPDGVLDDCWRGSDGLPDLYVLNPAWADVLVVGNFNSTRYEAFVLELVRRLYRGWQMEASYTWSQARGDAEDFNQLLGNDRTTAEDERGLLAYDQTHVFKLNATTYLPSGWRIGGTVQWESGLPFSSLASVSAEDAVPPAYFLTPTERDRVGYPTGQRNDSRNPAFWTFNARVQREWSIRAVTVGVSADAFNLLDDGTVRTLNVVNGTPEVVRRSGRRWQLGLRAAF